MGMRLEINSGRVVLDFHFSNITRLVFEGEIRKPCLDSQDNIAEIVDRRSLCVRVMLLE